MASARDAHRSRHDQPGGNGARHAALGPTTVADRHECTAAHDDTCVTCRGLQHRDELADAWLIWGSPYRRDLRRAS